MDKEFCNGQFTHSDMHVIPAKSTPGISVGHKWKLMWHRTPRPRFYSPQIPASLPTSLQPSEEWILAQLSGSKVLCPHGSQDGGLGSKKGTASWIHCYTQFNGPLCRVHGSFVWVQWSAEGRTVASGTGTGVISGLLLPPQSLAHGWGRLVMPISVLLNIFLHKLCQNLLTLWLPLLSTTLSSPCLSVCIWSRVGNMAWHF